ncbi:hypothetical protein PC9H_002453 [Pleurotus ostreatus]|uniref:Protein YAE1 n=1 Tax=Pleurotus ostreatus TaxID=5322 RepID=A0A8H7DM84_PLEOS|nr:uncharacterized protein PC9H_002453 [Pleurotus ostreatus]KAF7416189.1 hypothetical protein PC9H_002453 [Pleurotus ostreatus]KAJ8689031.1 hypothetical protein PTI98_013096 [Pleurotus ostreatus]
MESPWDDNPSSDTTRDTEWTKISSEFTNAGYREGITAGKEAALQEGFDAGFANVGAPLGRELGILRGFASALLSYIPTLSQPGAIDPNVDLEQMLSSARHIASSLSKVRFTDIAPRDLEAEEHAREHLDAEGIDMEQNPDLEEKRTMEGLEDLLSSMTTSGSPSQAGPKRPTIEDVRSLEEQLQTIAHYVQLDIPNDLN